ncbi:3-hydroxyacyl-ACP dehydratase FabZ [Rickettsiales bacterium]|nr:3-hydroxyacyl-ACP dehydratase FabZ [Rickettsiales bacterium]
MELSIEDIKKLIPHRYPFLLVDKIIDIVPFESATGIKNVTINENFFQGHFESKAVMPGALIVESMAQSAGSLVLYSLDKSGKKISVFLLSINKAKFRKQVCPGDVLKHKVSKKNQVKNIWKFSCKSYVDDSLVAEAELSAILEES